MAHFTISGLEDVTARPLAVVRVPASPGNRSQTIVDALGTVHARLDDASAGAETSSDVPVTARGAEVVVYTADGVEIGLQVEGVFTATGSVVPSTSPAGRAAHAVFLGDRTDLSEAHAALQWWCAEHGHRPSGVSWEVYGDPAESPADLRTDVYLLVDGPMRARRPAPRREAAHPGPPPAVKIETDEGVAPAVAISFGLLLMVAGVFMNWRHASARTHTGALIRYISRTSDIPVQFLFDSGTRVHDPTLLVILIPALVLGLMGLVLRRRLLLFACSALTLVLAVAYALQSIAFLDQVNRDLRGQFHFAYTDVVTEGLWLSVIGAIVIAVGGYFVRPRNAARVKE